MFEKKNLVRKLLRLMITTCLSKIGKIAFIKKDSKFRQLIGNLKDYGAFML